MLKGSEAQVAFSSVLPTDSWDPEKRRKGQVITGWEVGDRIKALGILILGRPEHQVECVWADGAKLFWGAIWLNWFPEL